VSEANHIDENRNAGSHYKLTEYCKRLYQTNESIAARIKSNMNENNLNLVCQEAASYGHEFKGHLFEQYKLYVEMADRVSSRRILVNPFFVDVHKILVTVFTVLLKEQILQSSLLGILPFLSVSLLCFSLVASRVFLPATQHGKIQGHHCIGSNAADSALMTRHGLRSAREKTENFIFRSLILRTGAGLFWCDVPIIGHGHLPLKAGRVNC